MVNLEVKNLTKKFNNKTVLNNISAINLALLPSSSL